jgi:hypothetical protein
VEAFTVPAQDPFKRGSAFSRRQGGYLVRHKASQTFPMLG